MDLIAVVLLIVLVFRMLRPLLFTLVTLGIATCAAMAACQFAFGNVHILTLTFGTSLIGVSVDYALHYFVNRMRDGAAAPHNIVPALILGCTTTVAGYLTLFVAPIPGLRQIALFSAVGLVVACACVILIYPGLEPGGLDRDTMQRAVPKWVARLAGARVEDLLPRAAWWVVVPLAFGACVWGFTRLHARDDVRALQRPPAELVASEKRVRSLLGVGFDTRFVLVTARTPELVLQRLEALAPVLARLASEGKIHGASESEPEPRLAPAPARGSRAAGAHGVRPGRCARARDAAARVRCREAIFARRAEFAAGEVADAHAGDLAREPALGAGAPPVARRARRGPRGRGAARRKHGARRRARRGRSRCPACVTSTRWPTFRTCSANTGASRAG